jgi:hypothetical protein
MSKIESLTPEQEARMADYAARWTDIALCTDLADRPRAEAAIREMYRLGSLKPPRKIVWCGSPLSMALSRSITIDGKRKGAWNRGWDGIAEGVWASVDESLADCAGNAGDGVDLLGHAEGTGGGLADAVEDSVFWHIYNDVWDNVWDGDVPGRWVKNSIRSSFWAIGASKRAGLRSVRGSIDCAEKAGQLAAYHYCHDVLGLTAETRKMSGLWELAQSAGWALPHRTICWVSERHNVLKRNEPGQMHSLTGPAFAWPDGFAIYAVHGVHVPPYVVERPEEITVERINSEDNAEVRRVMIERYRHGEDTSGIAAYMRDGGGERLDHDGRYGTLWRRDARAGEDEPTVMVEVVNSTPEPDGSRKRYWLRVPPDMQTAREAVAWTFGLSGAEYDPAKET